MSAKMKCVYQVCAEFQRLALSTRLQKKKSCARKKN